MEYVGIDLGTTNSAIASYDGENVALYKSPEQHDVTPSAIFIDRRGNKFVGSRAYANAARNPDNAATLFKRMMGTNTPIQLSAVDKVMTPEECSAEVLRTVFGYLPETMRRDGDTGTVITVPAAFNQMQKDATLAAAESAGIGRVALMQEPVAAVMSVMRQRNRDGTFLVFDLGGGTLDIAIAQSMKGRVSLLAHGGVEMCGGRDIDRALMDEVVKPWLVDTFDLGENFVADKRFRSLVRLATWAAERAKIELSRVADAVIALSETEIGVRDAAGEEIYIDIPIDRAALDRLIAPILDQAIEAARAALNQAGISAHDVDRVVFVGGPTQYKPLRDKVAFELGIAASTDVNPMTAVAEGAAIFAESIDWSTESRGRKASRSSLSSTGLEFAYVARTPDASARIVAKRVGAAIGEFQVDSLDTGWSSGRKEMKEGATIDLPLAKPGENAFRVFVFDASGGPVGISNDRIVISRTAASIDAIPASHTISIEVLEGRGGTRGLEPLVRAGDPLPKKGVVTFRSGEALRAGSPGALNFKLWEGDIREPVEDNMPIGTFRVTGSDFDDGMISIGSEIRCEYEITDGGTIRLDVSVPEIGGSFTSGHNYYARQDAQLDYAQAAGLVAVEAQSTMSRLDEFSKHIDDPRVEAIMERIEKASSLDVDRAEPEETKHALDEIRAARRDISNVRKDHLKVIRQLDLDGIVSSFEGWGREFALPEEARAFDALVRTAQHSIDANGSDFETHLAELRSKNIAALWRSDEFVVERFHWLSRSPEQFMDQTRYAALIQQGRNALAQPDMATLRDTLIHLDELRFTRGGEEEMLAMTNIMRGVMPASPFPQGTVLPNGHELGRLVRAVDPMFWIHMTRQRRRALLMTVDFSNSLPSNIERPDLDVLSFAGTEYLCLVAGGTLDVVDHLPRPTTADRGMAFAAALRRADEPFQSAIFDEAGERLIPFSDPALPLRDKADILGRYLTGGIEVRGDDIVALERILPKIDADELEAIITAAGLMPKTPIRSGKPARRSSGNQSKVPSKAISPFDLPGRPALADFFNEHVIEIVADEERYTALGIGFPGGVILEGPTGCGKTFAVDRLVEHLGWPSFNIEASSVASPYIHETSRKVAQVFADAIKVAPAVVVIDEMDAFLSSRDAGSNQHHVEEVAEFLRRIPEAAKNRVLVIGMTNQVDAIDPAILRRGRFDHVIHVDHAGREEVAALLVALLADIPNDVKDVASLAAALAGRPLSDVSFVVREAARLTARGKKERIGPDEIARALAKSPSRDADDRQRIGF